MAMNLDQRRKKVKSLHIQRRTPREISDQLRVDIRTVRRDLEAIEDQQRKFLDQIQKRRTN